MYLREGGRVGRYGTTGLSRLVLNVYNTTVSPRTLPKDYGYPISILWNRLVVSRESQTMVDEKIGKESVRVGFGSEVDLANIV